MKLCCQFVSLFILSQKQREFVYLVCLHIKNESMKIFSLLIEMSLPKLRTAPLRFYQVKMLDFLCFQLLKSERLLFFSMSRITGIKEFENVTRGFHRFLTFYLIKDTFIDQWNQLVTASVCFFSQILIFFSDFYKTSILNLASIPQKSSHIIRFLDKTSPEWFIKVCVTVKL